MIKLEKVLETQEEIFKEAKELVRIKGMDYNRDQQEQGDTLFNMRVSKILGITETTTQGVLTRISDKIMRLVSLTKTPGRQAAVKDESVKDTVRDLINYAVYLYLFFEEENEEFKRELLKHAEEEAKRLGAVDEELSCPTDSL